MSIAKSYHTAKPVCRATFVFPADAARDAETVCLVGDFNGWNNHATPMEKAEDGSFSVALDLEVGREYQFRYIVDGVRWENDWEADRYTPSPLGGSDNSVVIV
jgi:1,4-alpha-glucan branching enzyme